MIEIIEITRAHERLEEALLVMQQLRDKLTLEQLRSLFDDACVESGYRMFAVLDAGAIAAVSGLRIVTNFAYGRHVHVDDLVTDRDKRSRGFGAALLDNACIMAHASNCEYVTLDSGIQREDAHRFYLREGMAIVSHHFAKPA